MCGGRSSCTPSAHHSPSVTCAAAPSVAGLRLQRAYFLAAIDLWLPSPLGAPGSALPAPGCRLPPGRTWKSGAGRLKPRPPHPERGVVCPAPSNSQPSTTPKVARPSTQPQSRLTVVYALACWLHSVPTFDLGGGQI